MGFLDKAKAKGAELKAKAAERKSKAAEPTNAQESAEQSSQPPAEVKVAPEQQFSQSTVATYDQSKQAGTVADNDQSQQAGTVAVRSKGELQYSQSVQDLDDPENVLSEFSSYWPAGQKKGVILMLIRRLFTTRISSILLVKTEYDCLFGPDFPLKVKPLPRAAQVLAWRRTLLRVGVFFYAILTCTDFTGFVSSLANGYQTLFGGTLPERYEEYFAGVLALQYVFQAFVLIGNAMSIWYAAKAAVGWWSFKHSMKKVRFAFMFSYFPNFILLLCLPFNSGVDYVGLQRQLCSDIINDPSSLGIPFLPSSLNKSPLGQQLRTSYNINLPDFCDKNPEEYGDEIRRLLERAGRVEVNGNCPAASYLHKRMSVGDLSWEKCPEHCDKCLVEPCQSQLVPLATMAGAYGEEALNRPFLGEVQRDCAICVQDGGHGRQLGHDGHPGGCKSRCPEVMNAILAKSPSIMGGLPQCINPDDLKSIVDLSRVALTVTQWKVLLGAKYAGEAILKLLPLSFSLMLGSWKASGISKSVVPYSRMPGFASGASVLFTFPFLFQIVVVIQTIMGTPVSLFAFFFLLGAVIVVFPCRVPKLKLVGIIEPMSHEDAFREVKMVKKLQYVLGFLGILLLLIFVSTNELFKAGAQYAEEQGYEVSDDQKEVVQGMVAQAAINQAAATLGKALIATVFFVDSCLYLMHVFQQKDPARVEASRFKLMVHIHGLFGNFGSYESQIHPVDEEEEDPTERLSLKAIRTGSFSQGPPSNPTSPTSAASAPVQTISNQVPEDMEDPFRTGSTLNATAPAWVQVPGQPLPLDRLKVATHRIQLTQKIIRPAKSRAIEE
eukprot:gnl/MRDRNA2_/MRDRNA2_80412_c0_seq1.p1 gnl/MRDRNA2_/MRDRNA2_80412_c0~~gnl/MRDRNA2_/MRDRNA2_80412_c0_seq1.p1  ORF type:complete len:834 (-),score=116.70 gnl/MRDRNA2_/MRDRNA2_80412_c0_seq1:223-2724(-)